LALAFVALLLAPGTALVLVEAQQQVTIEYVPYTFRSLIGSEAPDTTYEVWLALPKSMFPGCGGFAVYTPDWRRAPVWVWECHDGDSTVRISLPQLTFTTSSPPAGWDSDPYFDDRGWVWWWSGAGRSDPVQNGNNIHIDAYMSYWHYLRFVVNLPVKPGSATLYVRAWIHTEVSSTMTWGVDGYLVKVNGAGVGSPISVTGDTRTTVREATLDVTQHLVAGANLIATARYNNYGSIGFYLTGFQLELRATFPGYWIARAFIKLPVSLTESPVTLYVVKQDSNTRDPATFIFADDFDVWDPSRYTISGTLTASTSGGKLTLSTTSSGTLTLRGSYSSPVAFIAKIDANAQSSFDTTLNLQAGGTTVTSVRISANNQRPTHFSGFNVYNGQWPWIVGYFASSTTAFRVVWQRYELFPSISLPSLGSYYTDSVSSYTPAVQLVSSYSGYTVSVTMDWIAVYKPPANIRNPVYVAGQPTIITVSATKITLPGQAPATVLAYRFNATIYGGDIYNSGLLALQGLIARKESSGSGLEALSFPSRSTLAVQLLFTGSFSVALAYYDARANSTSVEETLSYDGSTLALIDHRTGTVIASTSPPASSGYILLEVFGSERKLYVYTTAGTSSATGAWELRSFNTVLFNASSVPEVTVMEGALVTYTQQGLLAVRVEGVDAMGRPVDMFISDARHATAVGPDLDATPEIITIGTPLGAYPVEAVVTAYLDAQQAQYALIVPRIAVANVTLNPGAPGATPGGTLIDALVRPITALDTIVPEEHRPTIALASVIVLATLATLTTAFLFTILATAALLAFAAAGWISAPTALLTAILVVALLIGRRYVR